MNVVRMNAASEPGFCWIECASGVSGFVRSAKMQICLVFVYESRHFPSKHSPFDSSFTSSDYVSVRRSHARPATAAPSSSAPASSAGTVRDEPDDTVKAAAITAFHVAIRSTSRCFITACPPFGCSADLSCFQCVEAESHAARSLDFSHSVRSDCHRLLLRLHYCPFRSCRRCDDGRVVRGTCVSHEK